MEKILYVEGMTCEHCSARVEKALGAVKGVESARVDLKQKTASVRSAKPIGDKALIKAVTSAGYEVKEVKEIKEGNEIGEKGGNDA